MKKSELENTALQLKAFLTVLCAVDTDNPEALAEMPHALKPGVFLCSVIGLSCGVLRFFIWAFACWCILSYAVSF